MITIISATNRKDSQALRFARHYHETFEKLADEEIQLLALADVSHDWFHPDMYEQPSDSLIELQDNYILPAQKIFFIISEYNGGMPGAVKLFIDALTVREYSKNFKNKKVGMAGVASGRAGNLRGMEHLTGIMNYLGAIVMPNRLPISRISQLIGSDGTIVDEATLAVMEKHVQEFIGF